MGKEKFVVSASGDLELTMIRDKGRNERLGIRSEFPQTELAQDLFRYLGLMHLIAPYFPDRVVTDFAVPEGFRQLVGAMYETEGRSAPKFELTDRRLAKIERRWVIEPTGLDRAAVAYSGGKDSMWNLDWLLSEYGPDKVLAVHIKGMNLVNWDDEQKFTKRQSQAWGFGLEMVDLLNSSKSSGKSVMRSRDMFIVAMAIPLALRFGASKIVIEGGFWPDGQGEGSPFTTFMSSWERYNRLLMESGVPVQVNWRDCDGMTAIEDLAAHRPEWLPLVVNCFAPKHWRRKRLEKWARVAKSFPMYPSQCGSCVKCREFNIGRIGNDPNLAQTTEADIRALVADTLVWEKLHRVDLADILAGRFTQKLYALADKYGLT